MWAGRRFILPQPWSPRSMLGGGIARDDRQHTGQTIYRRFLLVSFVVLVVGMLSVGWWINREIEQGVIHHTAATTGIYVESIVAPLLSELSGPDSLSPVMQAELTRLVSSTAFSKHIVGFIVWDPNGRVLYSADSGQIGQRFALTQDLIDSIHGEVTAEMNAVGDLDHLPHQTSAQRLLAVYSPVRKPGTQEVIAVAEFYNEADRLYLEIVAAQTRSWLAILSISLLMYVSLFWFVRWAQRTITTQSATLNQQVQQLTDVLAQNDELHERVRRASARSAEVNERFLRRISADLHDGPAQYLGLALLRLDSLAAHAEICPHSKSSQNNLQVIQHSLESALEEVRTISAGLGLPELHSLTLEATIRRVVRTHEQRSGTRVKLMLDALPDQAPLPVKITVYRVVQEALNNAFRHADGIDQQVRASVNNGLLNLTIQDRGRGFQALAQGDDTGVHLGLVGMRERVESLGGQFRSYSRTGQGTTISVTLALQHDEVLHV